MIQPMHTRRQATKAVLAGAALATLADASEASSVTPSSGSRRAIDVAAKPGAFTFQTDSTAVLVVDMQNDFGATGGMFDRAGIDISGIRRVIDPVRKTLVAARAASLPIVYLKMAFLPDLSDSGAPDSPTWIKHKPLGAGTTANAPDGSASRILIRGTWNTEIVSELAPEVGDVVVYKSRFSGFYRTELDQILKARGVKTLIVTGCTTSVCVDSTVRDAMFRDYNCLVLEDCVAEPIGADLPRSNHEASLLTIQVLLGWISDSATLSRALAV